MEYNIGDRIVTETKDITITAKERRLRVDGNTQTMYQYKCNICGFDCRDYYYGGKYIEETWVTIAQLKRDKHCSCCASKAIKPEINSVAAAHPELIKFFKNKEDVYCYSWKSNKYVEMICPICGSEKTSKICNLVKNGICCPRCSDGLSIGERIMYIILKDNNIKFQKEFTFDDCNYRYDFYIDDFNMIIEINGKQHYIETSIDGSKHCLDRIIENDRKKKEFALNKVIELYVYIDCMESTVNYIVTSIEQSGILDVLHIAHIDEYELSQEIAYHSITKDICDMYNSRDDVSIIEIEDRLPFHRKTIRDHLKIGASLGWCDYETGKYRLTKRYKSGQKYSKLYKHKS